MESWEILDEFLEYCVEEHNGDFDAISKEFLEVASGLDHQLAGRAEEAFSAEALRQRWAQLRPEEATEEATEADTEVTVDQLPEVETTWKDEEAPSQFSVLTDSLQDRVRRIYNNVQLRLPSAYAEGSDAEDEAGEAGEGGTPRNDGASRHGSDSEENVEGALEDAALRLFGSANLGSVVADLSKDSGAPANGSPQKLEQRDLDPSGLIARALRGEDESSEDSAVDDFRAMRKAVKESSQQVAADPKVRKLRELPKAAVKASPKQIPKDRKPKVTPGFVRLELVESTSEEEEEEVSESSEEEEETQNSNHLRVLSRLESSAPNGECPWDVWLQATRSWPQLKAKLNSPDFSRKNGELCVHFDVFLLKKLVEEEKELRAAAKSAQLRAREDPTKVTEYIQEAERRRAMIGGRVGGFLLAPRSEKLEETLRREKPLRENVQVHVSPQAPPQQNIPSHVFPNSASKSTPFSPAPRDSKIIAPRGAQAKVSNSDDRLNAVKVN